MPATYRTSAAGGGTSGTGARTATITPVVGDLLIVFATMSGDTVGPTQPTCTDDNGGFYDTLGNEGFASDANHLHVFIRQSKMTNTTSTVVSVQGYGGSNTAGEVVVVAVAGMTLTGLSAKRSYGSQVNKAAGAPAPAPVLNQAALSSNLVITAIGCATNPPGLTAPTGWTSRQNVGQNTPSTGLQVATRDSGFTGTTVTWGSNAPSTYASVTIELDGTVAVAVNDTVAVTDTTTREEQLGRVSSDAVVVADSVIREYDPAPIVSDTVAASDSASRGFELSKVASDVIAVGAVDLADVFLTSYFRDFGGTGTVRKKFSFASNAEGLEDGLAHANITAAFQAGDSADGGAGGCVKFTSTTSSLSGAVEYMYPLSAAAQSWEDWGVPANKTVLKVAITSLSYRVVSATQLTAHRLLAYLADASEAVVLDGDAYVLDTGSLPTATGSWTLLGNANAEGPKNVLAAHQASSSTVELVLEYHLSTGGGAANVDVRFDEIEFEITYGSVSAVAGPWLSRPSQGTSATATSNGNTGEREFPVLGASVDPANIPLTGWVRGSYGGSPWAGVYGAGSSFGRDFTEATNPPGVGSAVNGFAPADFDGANDRLVGPTVGTLLGTDVTWWVGALVWIDTMPSSGTTVQVVGDANSQWGIFLASNGWFARHHDGTTQTTTPTDTNTVLCATGTWHYVELWCDSANTLQIHVDGYYTGAYATGMAALGATVRAASTVLGESASGTHFDGKILDVAFSDVDPVFRIGQIDRIRIGYVRNRYALSLGVDLIPTASGTLNGRGTVVFDGATQALQDEIHSVSNAYVVPSGFDGSGRTISLSLHILFKAYTLATPSVGGLAPWYEPRLWGTGNGTFGLAINSNGVYAWHHDDPLYTTYSSTTPVPVSTGQWYLVQYDYDGTTTKIRVNGGAWQSDAMSPTTMFGFLRVGSYGGDRYFDGEIALIASAGHLDDATHDAIFYWTKLAAQWGSYDGVAIPAEVLRELQLGRAINDVPVVTDSSARVSDADRVVTDTVALADAIARELELLRIASLDTVALSDSAAREEVFERLPADTVVVTDQASRISDADRTVSDAVVVAGSALREEQFERATADTVAATDTGTASREYDKFSSDTATLTDSGARGMEFGRVSSDAVAAVDLLAREENFERANNDTVATTDTVTRTSDPNRTVSDAVVVADSTTREEQFGRISSDAVVVADSTTREEEFARANADAVAVLDAGTASRQYDNFSSDTATLSDTTGAGFSFERVSSDAAVVSDSTTREEVFERLPADVVAVVDAAAREEQLERFSADAQALADDTEADLTIGSRLVEGGADDAVDTADAAARELDEARAASGSASTTDDAAAGLDLARAPSDAVVPVDAADRAVDYVRAASGTVSLTDDAGAGAEQTRVATDAVAVADDASRVSDANREADAAVAVADDAAGGLDLARSVDDAQAIADAAAYLLDVTIPRAVDDDVAVADDAARELDLARAAADAQAVSDSGSGTVAAERLAADAVPVTDQADRAVDYVRAAADAQAVSDAAAAELDLERLAVDAAALTDQADRELDLARANADAVDTADDEDAATNAALSVFTNDAVGLSDAALRELDEAREEADAIALADAAAPGVEAARAIDDAVSASDDVARELAEERAPADAVAMADALAREVDGARLVSDAVAAADQAARGLGFERAAEDLVATAGSALRTVAAERSAFDAVAPADEVDDLVNRLLSRTTSDAVAAVDQAVRGLDLARVPSDAVAAADATAGGLVTAPELADAVDAGDDVSREVQLARAAADAAAVADQAARELALERARADAAALADALAVARMLDRGADDAVAVAFEVDGYLDRTREFAVADVVGLLDAATAERLLARAVSDAVGVGDDLAHVLFGRLILTTRHVRVSGMSSGGRVVVWPMTEGDGVEVSAVHVRKTTV